LFRGFFRKRAKQQQQQQAQQKNQVVANQWYCSCHEVPY
jgi:hypothetical protein